MSDPTPQDRADYLVRKLEQYIRDSRTVRGVSFRDWQSMARDEIANSFAEVDRRRIEIQQDLLVRRLLLVVAGSLITIGFWGCVMSIDKAHGWMAALIMLASGTIMMFFLGDAGVRHLLRRGTAKRRRARFQRIEEFDRQLRRLEAEVRQKVKRVEAEASKTG